MLTSVARGAAGPFSPSGLAAGADHVMIRPLPMLGPAFPLAAYRALTPALLDL